MRVMVEAPGEDECEEIVSRLAEMVQSSWADSSMCGIIGCVGPRDCRDLLLEDCSVWSTAGMTPRASSLIENGSVGSVHAVGNLARLRDAVAASNGDLHGSTGIGHTRWATHGRVTEQNIRTGTPASGCT